MLPQLAALAASTFVSEDLACVTAGVLVARGDLEALPAVAACTAGILLGDLGLYFAGRGMGPSLFRHRWVRRWIVPERVEKAAGWIERQGLNVVFLSRFMPGLRLPTYIAAGMLSRRPIAFVSYFLIAASVWTPLAVLGTAWLGGSLATGTIFGFQLPFWLLAAVLGATVLLLRSLLIRAIRALLPGLRPYRKYLHWEFWPTWAAYAPLVPWWIALSLWHRSPLLFTLANPGMPAGGVCGESKSQILNHLSKVPGAVAPYRVIAASLPLFEKLAIVSSFLSVHRLSFPVVLKPDIGERGSGVAIVRGMDQAAAYLQESRGDVIVQQYIEGDEFGVFYVRYPNASRGRILSLTEKHFPVLTADGMHSLRELISRDPRAALIADIYEKHSPHDLRGVPAAGRAVQLVEIGSHCRGSIFLDGTRHVTPEMEAAFLRIANAHPGFYFGRFDIRAESLEALRAGRGFRVIELNGVAGEPAHIYDPAVSIWETYRVLFRHWSVAWKIGAMNRARGFRPPSFLELWSLFRSWSTIGVSTPLASESSESEASREAA